jgi:hypothetical protein
LITDDQNDSRGENPKKTRKTARERFFAVDARSWPKVCQLGMPAAVSYLVLACGSGGDQTTTRWSVDAITRHTGIGRPRAKAAVATLVKAGLVRIEKGGTRPQYSIVHAHQQTGTPPLTSEEQRIYDIISKGSNAVPKIGQHGTVWQYGKPYQAAVSLAEKGYLKDHGGHRFTIAEREAAPERPDLIWLPCSLVEAVKEDGLLTPVEQIRQSNNIHVLKLFIDLYRAHNLISGPGINWRPPHGLRFKYERVQLGQYGEYVVWGFKPLYPHVYFAAPFCEPHLDRTLENIATKFFEALKILTELHLVSPVVYLVDSDGEHGEEMWPIPLGGAGEECEKAVGLAAAKLTSLMLTDEQVQWANGLGLEAFCPVRRHVADVQAVGIYRLRHRPHTEATKAWFRDLQDQCKGAIERFEAMIAEIESVAPSSEHATSRIESVAPSSEHATSR